MNRLISEQTIELLDRKFNFVMDSSTETFMLDLGQFIKFLIHDELIKPVTSKLMWELAQKNIQYQTQLDREKENVIEIKRALLNHHPDIDQYPESEYSVVEFDLILNSEGLPVSTPYEKDLLNDCTEVAKLTKILRVLVDTYEEKNEKQKTRRRVDKEIHDRLRNLEAIHNHTHLGAINYARISPDVSLNRLIEKTENINPEPEDISGQIGMSEEAKSRWRHNSFRRERWGPKPIAFYLPDSLSSEKQEEYIRDLKLKLGRVYEAIRQEISTTRLHLQLLNRYKIRCQWYNQEVLRKLVLNQNGGFIRNKEDVLTRDLALYIYDQGVTSAYKVKRGKHEFDLVEMDANHPMFVEAKVYKDDRARSDLVTGISQLHSYLCNEEAYKNIHEAYYMIFRLGGPVYEFPYSISTNRFTIYPIFVDIGSSKDSGRNRVREFINWPA